MPLKNRQTQIPQGLSYLQPETSWRPDRWSSFDSIVAQVIAHRRGNPHLIEKNGWSVDPVTVANEVDNYNTRVCEQMGWFNFVEGGGPLPTPFPVPGTPQFHNPPHSLLQAVRNVVGGSLAIVDFVASRAEAVPDEQANARAATCSACPLNEKGDWLSTFTRPVAEAIRVKLQQRRGMNLSTPKDAELGVCGVCSCPIPLMIHFPLETKLEHMNKETHDRLPAHCWVITEEKDKADAIK